MRQWSTGTIGAAVGVLSGFVALGPVLLHRGYTLSYDMVFVPRPPITDAVLGVDGSVPRAVPNDLVVALLSRALPGDVVQKCLLLAVFVLGAWGVARLTQSAVAALVSAAAFVWNPYVYERLVIGHWGFLLGYALLPWVAGAAIAARRGGRRNVAGLCLVVAVSGLTGSTSLLLATVTAVAVVVAPGAARRTPRVATVGWLLAAALGSAAAWLVPVLTRDGGVPADPAGVAAFAAAADTPLGTLPSVLGLGGIWNEAVRPPERDVLVVALAGLAFVVAALVIGGPRLARAWDGAGAGMLASGAVGLVIAVAGTVPGLETVLRQVVLDVPGGGLLRDGQKFAALLALPVSLSAGLMAETARTWLGRAVVLLAVAPLVLLPSLAGGAGGRLSPVDYPGEWAWVRTTVAQHGGDVAVFPFRQYRRFDWNHDRVTLDPMPRYLPTRVVVNDDLPLTAVTVRGEDPRAARLRRAAEGRGDLPAVLRREGVALAVVHLDEADPDRTVRRLRGLPVLFDGHQLRVLAVGGVPPRHRDAPVPWGLVVAAVTLAGIIAARAIPARTPAASLEMTPGRSGSGGPEGEWGQMRAGSDSGFIAVIPLVASLVLGLVLAVVAALGLVASQSATPDPVDKPLVTYNGA